MSDYLNQTEEQQFEEVKNWFKQNGTVIAVVVCLVAASVFGWHFWQNHQLESSQKTSAQYQATLDSYLQNTDKNAPLMAQFIADHQGSYYAVFAQLQQAKQQVESGDFAAAQNTLTQALQQTDDATLQSVVRFRLALVEYQLKAFDSALNTLAAIKDNAWSFRKQVLVGDILLAKGDKAAAENAYQQAKSQASEADKALLDLRLNNL